MRNGLYENHVWVFVMSRQHFSQLYLRQKGWILLPLNPPYDPPLPPLWQPLLAVGFNQAFWQKAD